MAAASPTPMPNYTHSAGLRIARHYSGTRTFVRRDSPPSTANAALHGNAAAPGPSATSDDDDDDLQPPPQLSDLGRSVLEQHDDGVAVAASSSTSPRGSVNASTATTQQHQPQPQHPDHALARRAASAFFPAALCGVFVKLHVASVQDARAVDDDACGPVTARQARRAARSTRCAA